MASNRKRKLQLKKLKPITYTVSYNVKVPGGLWQRRERTFGTVSRQPTASILVLDVGMFTSLQLVPHQELDYVKKHTSHRR